MDSKAWLKKHLTRNDSWHSIERAPPSIRPISIQCGTFALRSIFGTSEIFFLYSLVLYCNKPVNLFIANISTRPTEYHALYIVRWLCIWVFVCAYVWVVVQFSARLPSSTCSDVYKRQRNHLQWVQEKRTRFRTELRFKQVNGRDFGESSLISICIGLANIVY